MVRFLDPGHEREGSLGRAVSAVDPELPAEALRAIVDRLPDGIVLLAEDGSIRMANGIARALLRCPIDIATSDDLFSLTETHGLDWSDLEEPLRMGRNQDAIVHGNDGRPLLAALRFVEREKNTAGTALLVLRDLQVLDHLRRIAAGTRGGEAFRFATDRDIAPDFRMQRRISPKMDRTIERGLRGLNQGARILLTAESGTGKTELAKYLHRQLCRPEEAFVHVNCGSIPETLFESEMFGHEKGAFTGAATCGRKGLIEKADGGMLFLDEIGDLPLALQAKLLKFFDDGLVQRVGGHRARRVNCRIVSATNQDLWRLVQKGRFREDLYYRLAVLPLTLSPLREQPEMIDHLIEHYLSIANRARAASMSLDDDCYATLRSYTYPGNIRELRNLLQQLSIAAGPMATVDDLPNYVRASNPTAAVSRPTDTSNPEASAPGTGKGNMKERVRAYERALIRDAIRQYGSKRGAARALGVDIGTIVRKTRDQTPM